MSNKELIKSLLVFIVGGSFGVIIASDIIPISRTAAVIGFVTFVALTML